MFILLTPRTLAHTDMCVYSLRAIISSSDAPAAVCTGGAGRGYGGVAVAAGVVVLVSVAMLASYVCVVTKAVAAHAATLLITDEAAPPAADAARGLDGAAIDALYPSFLHAGGGGGEEEEEGPCAVCLGEFAPGDALRRGAGCAHCFHAACAERWLRVSATCPVCRDSPAAGARSPRRRRWWTPPCSSPRTRGEPPATQMPFLLRAHKSQPGRHGQ
ncbi:hypothetical protein ACP4OV_014491 [Aristida adscensionis]